MQDITLVIERAINAATKKKLSADNFCLTYARVSSDDQKDFGNSLDEQKKRLTKYVSDKKLHPLYSYSSSESAFKEGRKNFNHMLEMVEKFKIKTIVLKNYDRATRNDFDWPKVLKLIKEKKLILHFYELNQILKDDSKAEEFFNADIQVAMAKYWSNKISQGVKSAFDSFITDDAAPTPVRGIDGYMLAMTSEKTPRPEKPRRWIIDKSREKIIRRMFALCIEGHSLRKIAEILRSEKVLTKGITSKKKNPTPAPFTIASIERILKHPMFAGHFEKDGELIKGNIEPYCTLEELEERKALLDGRHCWNKGKGVDHLYRGLIYCPHCGKLNSGWTQRLNKGLYEYVYYSHVCNAEDGKSIKIKEEKFTKLLDNKILQFRFNNMQAEYLKNILQNILTTETDLTKNERETLNNKINALISQRKNITGLFAENVIPKDELLERVTIINNEIKQTEEALLTITDDITEYHDDVIDIIDYLKNFNELYDQLDEREKVQYLKCIIKKVYLDGEEIKLEFKAPFAHLLNEKTVKEMANFRVLTWVDDNNLKNTAIYAAVKATLLDFSHQTIQ